MRLEKATITLRPRSVSNCLDLAIMFAARHFRPLLTLWLSVAVPTCAGIWLLLEYGGGDISGLAVILFLASSPLGVLTAIGAIPSALGEPFALERMWRSPRRTLRLIGQGLLLRIPIALGLFLCVVPGAWLAARYGFFVEQDSLRELDEQLASRPTGQLVNEEASELIARGLVILAFCTVLVVVLFLTVDTACQLLFDWPVLLGRVESAQKLSEAADRVDEFSKLLVRDPRVLTVLGAVVLFVCPIGRLAWFFCYVDLRVRRDLWDMELRFSEEERHLQETA